MIGANEIELEERRDRAHDARSAWYSKEDFASYLKAITPPKEP